MVQEPHLCGHVCIGDISALALGRGEICPTVFVSVGLREYVSVVGAVNGIFIISYCKQVALEFKSVVFFSCMCKFT